MQHEENWVILAEILGPRCVYLKPLIAAFKTPEAIFAASEEELRAVMPHAGRATLDALKTRRCAELVHNTVLWCHRSGVRILTYDSDAYPRVLRAMEDPPAVLYCLGALPDLDKTATLGIVGTRSTDAYGESMAYKLSFELAAAGVTVVSGLAEGIDGIATAAALQAGGRAVAVLGCGIDIAYPKQHGKLMRECAQCGAVITEYFPGTKPYGYNFPMRNRIISALSDALLVVQAPRQSGALITARYALAQGKRLYTVPANVTSCCSEGSNRLLQAGAVPVLESEDIFTAFSARYGDGVCADVLTEATQHSALDADVLAAFNVKYRKSAAQAVAEESVAPKKRAVNKKEESPAPRSEPTTRDTNSALSLLNERQQLLWSRLPEAPFTVDCLVEQGVSVSEAVGTLTMFEIYGLLVSKPGGIFERK